MKLLRQSLWFLGFCVAAAQAQEARFNIFEYRVEGTTLIPVLTVEKAVYLHMGEQKSLDDVEKARDSLEKAYHGVGYLTVLVWSGAGVNRGCAQALNETPITRVSRPLQQGFHLNPINT